MQEESLQSHRGTGSIAQVRTTNALLAFLLVVAVAAVDLVFIRWHSDWALTFGDVNNWQDLTISAVGIGLGIAQFGFVVSWVMFERNRLALRCFLPLVGVLGFAAFVSKFSLHSTTDWLGVLALYGIEVALIWLVLTYLRFEVRIPNRTELDESPRQFSLARMMALLSAMSVYFAILRWARFPWDHALEVVSFCTGFAIITVALIRAVKRTSRPAQTSILLFAASAIVGVVVGWIGGKITVGLAVCMAQAACTLAISLAVRAGIVVTPRET